MKNAMTYHAPTQQFTITPDSLRLASDAMLWAIKCLRESHHLDLRGYKIEGSMQAPQFAESAILEAARAVGIDLGADRYGRLDVSNR
jgi:hypothetical protein